MDGMSMSGGWTMPMMWMRMPGHSWAGTAASFLVMWSAMMAAMMLPSLVPALLRYPSALRHARGAHGHRLVAVVGGGYFSVWVAFGLIVFPIGAVLTAITMQQPVLALIKPIAAGGVVLFAGLIQHSAWKSRRLAVCRETPSPSHPQRADRRSAWRHGVCLGLHCTASCAPLTAVLLVLGMMDLRVMAAITAAITLERLAPSDVRVVHAIGDGVIVTGLILMARAAGLA
jgi:predicted metal-binding membrane protein